MEILIVEDDFISSKLMEKLLKPYGNVSVAGDGVEALEQIENIVKKNKYFDVIFLDIMMPRLNGHDTLIKLREYEEKVGKKSRVIMITALNDFENIKSAYSEDCEYYVIKPINKKMIAAALEKVGLIKED